MIVWCKDTLAHAVLDTFIALINELVYELYTRLRQFWSWKSEEWKYKDIVQRVFFGKYGWMIWGFPFIVTRIFLKSYYIYIEYWYEYAPYGSFVFSTVVKYLLVNKCKMF